MNFIGEGTSKGNQTKFVKDGCVLQRRHHGV